MPWPSSAPSAAGRFIARGGSPKARSPTTERDGARTLLVLRNGLKVPVSKSFRDQAKEMGWLSHFLPALTGEAVTGGG